MAAGHLPPSDAGPPRPRAWQPPRTDRERALLTRGTLILHLRPARLPAAALRWTHTFGLGGSALVLWGLLAGSGMLMLLVYQPTPAAAHESVRELGSAVRGGALVRGAHFWSANLLVVVAVLHLLRVVLTGGFHGPRRANWVVGTALLGLTLLAAFSGYLLTWDQRAFWAVMISANMLASVPLVGEALRAILLGGSEIGPGTLLGFYAWHTTFLPVATIAAMALHFWWVRKARGVVLPALPDDAPPRQTVTFLPGLLVRECAQALAVIATVLVLTAMFVAPLGAPANPGLSPNPAKAAWYFMGFQELLLHLHPLFAVTVLPGLGLVGLLALPWLGDESGPVGRWFLSRGGARSAVFATGCGAVLTAAAVVVDDQFAATGAPDWFLRGLLPSLVLAAMAWGVVRIARRRWQLGRNEQLQTAVVFAAASFATLTVVGVFCRGAGMALAWPWEL